MPLRRCKICACTENETPFADRHLVCRPCYRKKRNLQRKQRLSVGLCECGRNPDKGKRLCSQCLHRRKIQYQKHHEQVCTSTAKRYKKNKSRWNQLARERHHRIKHLVLQHYGMKCSCPNCPETRTEFLTIDHLNNDGAEQRRQLGSGVYRWIVRNNFPAQFATVCYNCNSGRYLYGICPHLRPATDNVSVLHS